MNRVCALILALVCTAPAGAAHVAYTMRFDPQAAELHARVCVAAAADLRRFVAAHERAGEFLRDARRSSGTTLDRREGALLAHDWQAGECLQYRVDLAPIADARSPGLGWRAGEDLLLSPHAFLWRPTDRARDPDAEIVIELPDGWQLSVPWQPLGDERPLRRFRLGTTSPQWPAVVAIGRFDEVALAAPGGAVRLAIPGPATAAQRRTLTRYVDETAADVGASFPHLFASLPQVLPIAIAARAGDAIPFGQSYRGGATAILLYVDPGRALADYHRSWTLTHEFVHLAHPYLGDGGRWIGEGIATWYQNVIRARRGRYSARRAWDELIAGFERGRRQASDLSLTQTSTQLDRTRHYMRAYWAGTALMLRGDLALRTRDHAPASLDLALDRFATCCLALRVRRSAPEFLGVLDRQVGGDVFSTLHREHADRSAFPDPGPALAALGIEQVDGRITRMSDDPRHVALRTAMMGSD